MDFFQRQEIRKQMITRMFGKDPDQVTRNELIVMVLRKDREVEFLFKELFFENPNHKTFDAVPEDVIAPLRVANVLRHGEYEQKNK